MISRGLNRRGALATLGLNPRRDLSAPAPLTGVTVDTVTVTLGLSAVSDVRLGATAIASVRLGIFDDGEG